MAESILRSLGCIAERRVRIATAKRQAVLGSTLGNQWSVAQAMFENPFHFLCGESLARTSTKPSRAALSIICWTWSGAIIGNSP